MTVSDRSGVPRSYRMRKRQEDIEVTRQRIVDAAVLLHGTVGPAHTTISAVAEQAGVQRSTVYRHFPDEAALFGACTGHWLAANPWPRPQDWERIADPAERMHRGLRELYRYYDENRQMLGNSFRDIEVMPPFVGEMVRATLQGLVTGLVSGWPEAQQSERLVAAVRGAVDFRTSRAFVEAGLAPAAAADLVADMVLGVVKPG